MNQPKNRRFDGLLGAAAGVCVLALFFGLGTMAFAYDPAVVNKLLFGKLFFAAPFATCAAFVLVFISRRLAAWGVCFAATVSFLGSLSAMAYECSHQGCFDLRFDALMKAQIAIMALLTPQTGLSLTVASLVLVSNRRAKAYSR